MTQINGLNKLSNNNNAMSRLQDIVKGLSITYLQGNEVESSEYKDFIRRLNENYGTNVLFGNLYNWKGFESYLPDGYSFTSQGVLIGPDGKAYVLNGFLGGSNYKIDWGAAPMTTTFRLNTPTERTLKWYPVETPQRTVPTLKLSIKYQPPSKSLPSKDLYYWPTLYDGDYSSRGWDTLTREWAESPRSDLKLYTQEEFDKQVKDYIAWLKNNQQIDSSRMKQFIQDLQDRTLFKVGAEPLDTEDMPLDTSIEEKTYSTPVLSPALQISFKRGGRLRLIQKYNK